MARTRESGNKKQREPRAGVFDRTVDRRAFFDKVVLSVWGERRPSPKGILRGINRPIGGQNRNYARSARGVLVASGNPFELRYGLMRLRGVIPPLTLALRSEKKPLVATDVSAALESLCAEGYRATVAQVELTFDRPEYPSSGYVIDSLPVHEEFVGSGTTLADAPSTSVEELRRGRSEFTKRRTMSCGWSSFSGVLFYERSG